MKNINSILFFSLLFPLSLFSQVQGDGGVPKTFKKTSNYKTIDTWLFETPDLVSLKQEDNQYDNSGDRPWRFGYNNYTALNLHNSGTWMDLKNGGRIWQLVLTCENALTVNLSFTNTDIPEGNELYVYNPDKSFILGSFNQNHIYNGELGTELVPGNTVVVEYYIPKEGQEGFINVNTVTHGYRTASEFMEKAFGGSGSCNMNVNCPDGSSWVNERNSVVMLVSGSSGFCTGALVNNVLNDGKPYVLTANHCYSNPANWIFRFNWQSSGCMNPGSSPSFVSLSGATLRSRRTPTDFCLVEITGGLTNNTVPSSYNPFFAGWDKTGTIPTSTVGIHHPSGDIKKISFDDNPATVSQAMGSSENNSTWTVQWDRNTTTEGGSSGSPLFDQSHRIIGQLWGGGASCSNQSAPDYYGRFSKSWNPSGSNQSSQLMHWLDPNNSGAEFVNGFDPSGASAAQYDAGVSNANLNETEVCAIYYIPSFVLSNSGSETLTSATILYSIDGAATQTYNWSGSLAQFATETITLPQVSLASGTHTISVEVTNPNGNTDENVNNNSASGSVDVAVVPETAGYVTISLLTDDYSDETYMEMTNSNGVVVWSEGNENVAENYNTGDAPPEADPTSPLENNTAYEWQVSLPSLDCFTFTVYDYYGDGVDSEQWGGTNGDLEIKDNFGSVIYSLPDPNFGGDESSVLRNITVGIEDHEADIFAIYPNPARDFISLVCNPFMAVSYEIADLLGKTYFIGSVSFNETTINTRSLSSGTYLFNLKKKDGSVEHKKFIIK